MNRAFLHPSSIPLTINNNKSSEMIQGGERREDGSTVLDVKGSYVRHGEHADCEPLRMSCLVPRLHLSGAAPPAVFLGGFISTSIHNHLMRQTVLSSCNPAPPPRCPKIPKSLYKKKVDKTLNLTVPSPTPMYLLKRMPKPHKDHQLSKERTYLSYNTDLL